MSFLHFFFKDAASIMLRTSAVYKILRVVTFEIENVILSHHHIINVYLGLQGPQSFKDFRMLSALCV